MTSLRVLTHQWTLTEEAFRQFLARLDPDQEQAGQAYEALRLKLNYFFETRRCALPESLTDETINRLIRKVSEGAQILNLNSYAFTIAKYIYLESQPGRRTASLEDCRPEDDLKAAQRAETLRREMAENLFRSDCMKKCLAKLPPATQELLIEYYQDTGRTQIECRQRMAEARGLTANALYIQVHRVREKLEECLANCLKKA